MEKTRIECKYECHVSRMILQLRRKEKNYEDSRNVVKKINNTLKEHLSENQSMDNNESTLRTSDKCKCSAKRYKIGDTARLFLLGK